MDTLLLLLLLLALPAACAVGATLVARPSRAGVQLRLRVTRAPSRHQRACQG